MNITLIVAIVSILSGIVGIFVQLNKIRTDNEAEKKAKAEAEETKEKQILTMLDNDKKRLDKLDSAVDKITEHLEFQSDMIYQMLDHMASNNNTGGMKDALDRYNKHFRRNL